MDSCILAHEINRFNGVEINTDSLPQDTESFAHRLTNSLAVWQADGRYLVWLELPISMAALISPATAAGFVFHHSTECSLTLLYTLTDTTAVPTYATHYIGAGGVVFNDRKELLVVSERHRRDLSRPYYKLPGGALSPGEHLVKGVIREVYEETGVRAVFEALVGFRHWHGYRWNKSDIYFICRLAAHSHDISIQTSEIEEALWMPIEQYLNSEHVSVFNKRVVRAAHDSPGISTEDIEGYADPDRFEFFMPLSWHSRQI